MLFGNRNESRETDRRTTTSGEKLMGLMLRCSSEPNGVRSLLPTQISENSDENSESEGANPNQHTSCISLGAWAALASAASPTAFMQSKRLSSIS